MTGDTPAPPRTQGQLTVEQMHQQMQISAMSTLNLQLVSYLASNPPVSGWPVEVRKYMYNQLTKCLGLFSPQTEEEATFYAQQ